MDCISFVGLPRWCHWRRCKRREFDPWVRKIPWRKAWQSTPVFLPGESHGQRSLVGYDPWGHKEWDTTKAIEHTCIPNTQHSILHKVSRYSINTYRMNKWINRTKRERELTHLHTPSSWMRDRWSRAQGGRRKPSFHNWTKLRKVTVYLPSLVNSAKILSDALLGQEEE